MRISASCPVCLGMALDRQAPAQEVRCVFERRYPTLLTHTRSATATCDSGHLFGVTITEPAFALIFERALQRLVDGDWRDAVLDAYTALEMYMSTVPVRARYDRDPQLVPADVAQLRKDLKFALSDSNKTLGAALAVVSVVAGRAPPKFDQELATLRNKAVHAGEYPSPEKAQWLVLEVERLITEIEEMLDAASGDRDPPFRLAVQIAEFPKPDGEVDAYSSVSICAALSGSTVPRETATARIARYRSGELGGIRLY